MQEHKLRAFENWVLRRIFEKRKIRNIIFLVRWYSINWNRGQLGFGNFKH
jgi:hypothetical protein